jgi:hypothetical protein
MALHCDADMVGAIIGALQIKFLSGLAGVRRFTPSPRWFAASENTIFIAIRGGVRRSIGDGRLNKSLKLKLGFANRSTVVQTGIKGVARRSLPAWGGQRVCRLALTLHST